MLIEEAKWLGKQLCDLGNEYFPMINIGSSSIIYRTQIQPHIDEFIFKPLREQNKKVFHTDIKNEEGVDLVGDLTDEQYIMQLKSMGIKIILCSNVLEHVEYPQNLCLCLEKIIPSEGIIIVTVPHRYPYHRDPIDTKFRPSIEQLFELFSDSVLLKSELVTSSETHAKSLWKKFCHGNFLDIFNIVKRWILPLRGTDEWRKARTDMFHLFKPFQITCIILKKKTL